MIMTNYVSDELANKVYHLTKALNKADDLIKVLEQQNEFLKKTLEELSPQTNTDPESVKMCA
jgi:ABC-type transporter Mla subunit MlaD